MALQMCHFTFHQGGFSVAITSLPLSLSLRAIGLKVVGLSKFAPIPPKQVANPNQQCKRCQSSIGEDDGLLLTRSSDQMENVM
jgi:hypothetical protein